MDSSLRSRPADATSADADAAIELAAELLQRAVAMQTPQERRQQAELDRLVAHDEDKATLIEMTDQAFRTHTPARVADQLSHLLDVQGIPRFFSPVEHAMLRGFQSFGEYLPGVAVPLVKEKMRQETANVILPAERETLTRHLSRRHEHGLEMNVNLLGEALLGEVETRRRMQAYVDALRLPELPCLSVKVSTLYSQISPLARRHTIQVVSDRLEMLYRTAMDETDPLTGLGKFVYLDMEEYRDLHLTADVLIETLDRRGLESARAGIALQAYVPDSHGVMRRLLDWSARRVGSGGRPLTIRLVKGANMEMERVEASIAGWPQAPYKTKRQTDANFKRMLRELLHAAARGEARVGVASHNLFDVALAMIWSDRWGNGEGVQFEMLEGMANHQRRAISDRVTRMLLYAPACRKDDFLYAIGYLIRRLDENTGPDNFLRHAYRLRVGSPEFNSLAADFRGSLAEIESVSSQPRRTQDRRVPPARPPAPTHWNDFVNEPDTDWSLPHNAGWIEEVLERWKRRCDDEAPQVPLRIGVRTIEPADGYTEESNDPSRPGVVACRYQKATVGQLREAVSLAAEDPAGWRTQTAYHRRDRIRAAAQNLRERRGDLLASMVADGGKTVAESDPEVSEAIDFAELYAMTAVHWSERRSIELAPCGVVAVVTPWNFPLAIPCGGIAASLAAGNTVLLKPAKQTVLIAWLLCNAFWDAGVPREALQLVPCDDESAEAGLIANRQVDAVVFTGGTATAKRMLSVRPGLRLLAETGGKNATIVTSMADRELAVKHVIQSAFGNSGQKCSATSLLLLEEEVFHDPAFRDTLADAVKSLPVGSAWDLHHRVGPLIAPPSEKLTRGMTVLDDDESWLVVPEHVVGNPNLYRPGVKWNVRPGSFMHRTELFGPVLGVMSFRRLEEAIEIVRSTGYGLTSGLESLDDREIELWRDTIYAGNLYINRHTTGAIVLRQPFGGLGLSAHGPGVKAGGPHYVLSLCSISDPPAEATHVDAAAIDASREPRRQSESRDAGRSRSATDHPPLDRFLSWLDDSQEEARVGVELSRQVSAAVESQKAAVDEEFGQMHDTLRLVGQDNWRRYRPTRAMTIRVSQTDRLRDALVALAAVTAVGTQVTLSVDPFRSAEELRLLESVADYLPGLIEPIEETAEELVGRIVDGYVRRMRLLQPGDATSRLLEACAEHFVTVIDDPVLADGRIECLRYLQEQSISHDYHRYGNLGRRASEPRRDVL